MSAVVLFIEIELFIPAAQSLKDKRQVIASLQAGLRQTFRLPLAEVDFQDSWQRARLALVGVGSERQSMLPLIDRIRDYVVERVPGELLSYKVEWLK